MDSDVRTAKSFAGATIAVAVGTYLPWITTNPDLPPDAEIPSIYQFGMATGFEGFDFALLGAIGLVLLAVVPFRTSTHAVLTLATGLGIVAFQLYYLSTSSLVGFAATFTPAVGWHLTVLGGVLFALVGGFQLSSVIRRPTATPRQMDG